VKEALASYTYCLLEHKMMV